MNKLWRKEYHLRAGDFDQFNRIKPSAVLELFQDAAGQHAEELGLGFEAMLARSYLWVLTRIRFRILAQPKSYQRVVIKTWPLEPNRLNYRREYCMEDEQGNRLIAGSSEWVVIHSEKRRFVSVPDLYPFTDGFHPELMFEEKLVKIPDFESAEPPYPVTPGFCELDVNGHVNNTKYANYVLDAVNPGRDEELVEVQIDYRKEVLQGVRLEISHAKQEDYIFAKGQNESGDTMFACRLEYQKQEKE